MWFIFTNNCFFYIWYDVFESGLTNYTRIVPKCYLVLYHALYLDILCYIHDDISLQRLWNQDLIYILSFFLCFHLLVYLQLLWYLFQHQISHSCRARAIYLWNFFFFLTKQTYWFENSTWLAWAWSGAGTARNFWFNFFFCNICANSICSILFVVFAMIPIIFSEYIW